MSVKLREMVSHMNMEQAQTLGVGWEGVLKLKNIGLEENTCSVKTETLNSACFKEWN